MPIQAMVEKVYFFAHGLNGFITILILHARGTLASEELAAATP